MEHYNLSMKLVQLDIELFMEESISQSQFL